MQLPRLLTIALLLNLPSIAGAVEQAASPATNGCRLANLDILKGMARLTVEQRVSAALGVKSQYSPLANNLRGGAQTYDDVGCTLKVTYSPGSPAPLIARPGSGTQHLPPKDEQVLSVELR
jgi:hypothetical protein